MNKENDSKTLRAVSDEELNQVVGGSISFNRSYDKAMEICLAFRDEAACNANDMCVWEYGHCVGDKNYDPEKKEKP